MAVIAPVIFAVIKPDDLMDKLRTRHMGIGDPYPVCMAEKTVAHHDPVLQLFTPGGLKGVPGRIEGPGSHLPGRSGEAVDQKIDD